MMSKYAEIELQKQKTKQATQILANNRLDTYFSEYSSYDTIKSVAQSVGVAPLYVSNYIKEHNIPKTKELLYVITPDILLDVEQRVQEKYDEGYSYMSCGSFARIVKLLSKYLTAYLESQDKTEFGEICNLIPIQYLKDIQGYIESHLNNIIYKEVSEYAKVSYSLIQMYMKLKGIHSNSQNKKCLE